MSNYGGEAADLAKLRGSLVINMGTVTPAGLEDYVVALRTYNNYGGPVVFDPVGAGATQTRRDAVNRLLSEGYFDMIKGNEQEIKSVLGEGGVQQRGVDSGSSALTNVDRAKLVKKLALRESRDILFHTGMGKMLTYSRKCYLNDGSHRLP
jgi:thiamine-phosphate diphosphorylase / hydroxyethylthiazole kinase